MAKVERHPDIAHWADFVRGLGSEAERQASAVHLEDGCSRCQRAVDFLRTLAVAAEAEGRCEVPESVVHEARALFAHGRYPRLRTLPRILAQLAFDSLAQPLPAGVRALSSAGRHALYRAGGFAVDVQVSQDAGSARVSLVGQVTREADPEHPRARDVVWLCHGDRILSTAEANEFGEFHFECEPRRGLKLCMPVEAATRRVEVPLDQLLADKPAAGKALGTRGGGRPRSRR